MTFFVYQKVVNYIQLEYSTHDYQTLLLNAITPQTNTELARTGLYILLNTC